VLLAEPASTVACVIGEVAVAVTVCPGASVPGERGVGQVITGALRPGTVLAGVVAVSVVLPLFVTM